MYLGPRSDKLFGSSPAKQRCHYDEVARFDNMAMFEAWWKPQKHNWRISSRHPHLEGTCEYYECAYKKQYNCQVRVRVILAHDDSFVSLARSREHKRHSHEQDRTVPPLQLRPANSVAAEGAEPGPSSQPSAVYTVVELEPYPMQQAQLVMIPKWAGTDEQSSTSSAQQLVKLEADSDGDSVPAEEGSASSATQLATLEDEFASVTTVSQGSTSQQFALFEDDCNSVPVEASASLAQQLAKFDEDGASVPTASEFSDDEEPSSELFGDPSH